MSAKSAPRLVCIGRLTIDDVHLPDGTVTPNSPGGNALYSALGARLWEPSTEMVVAVGDDLPQQTASQISESGFQTDGHRRRKAPTLHTQVFYDEQGNRRWNQLSTEQDSHLLSPMPEDIPVHYLSADIFLVKAMSLDALQALIPWLRDHTQGMIAFDPKEALIPGNENVLKKLIAKVDIFLPSQEEATLLEPGDDWVNIARSFAALGPWLVAIKRNKNGSLVHKAEEDICFDVPAYPVDVVDATGAGDAYCGGFLAMFLRKPDDLETCARAGAVSASFAISGFGTQRLAVATPQEAEKRFAHWQ